jgi:cation transport regulator ChaC
MTDRIYYFAYGSNMDAPRLRERLRRGDENFAERRHCILERYRLAFDKVSSKDDRIGFANIVPDATGRVEGTLNLLSARGLDILDAVELVPHHYTRSYVLVREPVSGDLIRAATYVANPQMIRPNLRPDKAYLAYLLAAADVLSPAYIAEIFATKCWD